MKIPRWLIEWWNRREGFFTCDTCRERIARIRGDWHHVDEYGNYVYRPHRPKPPVTVIGHRRA